MKITEKQLKDLIRETIHEEMKSTLNEEFQKVNFNSHKKHNPYCDILEGHYKDSFITYGIYIKDSSSEWKTGDEFMEYYTGDYGKSGKKSFSRLFRPEKIPGKYKNDWLKLKKLYEKKYKNK